MFGKLLKYEWKANYKLFGLLSLIALVLGLVGGIAIRSMFLISETLQDSFTMGMSMLGLFGMVMICIILIGVYATAVSYINYFRFYKHKFTDEGYLTFTLPVTAESIFWSSFVNIMLWTVICAIVASAAIIIMFCVGVGPTFVEEIYAAIQESGVPEVTFRDVWELCSVLWDGIKLIAEEGLMQSGAPLYYGMSGLQILIAPVYQAILIMTCITVGSVLVKRMKLLLSIGIYMGFNSVIGVLTQISVYVPTFIAVNDFEHYFYWLSIPMVLQLVLQIGVIIGGYFLMIHLMKKKLNLP